MMNPHIPMANKENDHENRFASRVLRLSACLQPPASSTQLKPLNRREKCSAQNLSRANLWLRNYLSIFIF
jgi:hypothetical protein